MLRMVFVPFIVIELVEGRYFWAFDALRDCRLQRCLDGLLARKLHQQTLLGQYLDPIADKLLLSTMFLVLSILHKIPWKFTVLVSAATRLFWRPVRCCLLLRDCATSSLVFSVRQNTFSQIAAVFFVMLFCLRPQRWVWITRTVFLRATFAFTIISALHYVFLVPTPLRMHAHALPVHSSADIPAS